MLQNRSSTSHALRHVVLEPIVLSGTFPLAGGPYAFSCRTLPELHLHDMLEIGLCHRGDGVFVVEDKVLSFQTGDVILISPTEAHRAYSPRGVRCECSFYFVDVPALLAGLVTHSDLLDSAWRAGRGFPNRFRPSEAPELCRLITQFVQEAVERKPQYQDAIRGLLIQILVELQRRFSSAASAPPPRSYDAMLRLRPALQAIAQDYARPLTVPDLAARCALSVPHFRRLFTTLLGRSPLDYLHAYRIAQAGYLLRHTQEPVGSIAWSVGFVSLSSFHRQFQQRFGCSPLDWRAGRITAAAQAAC